MFGTQLYLVLHNVTIIEYQKVDGPSPYSEHSWLRNLKQVLGEDTAFWLLPTAPVLKINGHEYAKQEGEMRTIEMSVR